jgi:hypothetical protein
MTTHNLPMPLSATPHLSTAPIRPAPATNAAYKLKVKNPQTKNCIGTRNRSANTSSVDTVPVLSSRSLCSTLSADPHHVGQAFQPDKCAFSARNSKPHHPGLSPHYVRVMSEYSYLPNTPNLDLSERNTRFANVECKSTLTSNFYFRCAHLMPRVCSLSSIRVGVALGYPNRAVLKNREFQAENPTVTCCTCWFTPTPVLCFCNFLPCDTTGNHHEPSIKNRPASNSLQTTSDRIHFPKPPAMNPPRMIASKPRVCLLMSQVCPQQTPPCVAPKAKLEIHTCVSEVRNNPKQQKPCSHSPASSATHNHPALHKPFPLY